MMAGSGFLGAPAPPTARRRAAAAAAVLCAPRVTAALARAAGDVAISGYLDKKSPSGFIGGRGAPLVAAASLLEPSATRAVHPWQRRWFEVTETFFSYYTDESQAWQRAAARRAERGASADRAHQLHQVGRRDLCALAEPQGRCGRPRAADSGRPRALTHTRLRALRREALRCDGARFIGQDARVRPARFFVREGARVVRACATEWPPTRRRPSHVGRVAAIQDEMNKFEALAVVRPASGERGAARSALAVRCSRSRCSRTCGRNVRPPARRYAQFHSWGLAGTHAGCRARAGRCTSARRPWPWASRARAPARRGPRRGARWRCQGPRHPSPPRRRRTPRARRSRASSTRARSQSAWLSAAAAARVGADAGGCAQCGHQPQHEGHCDAVSRGCFLVLQGTAAARTFAEAVLTRAAGSGARCAGRSSRTCWRCERCDGGRSDAHARSPATRSALPERPRDPAARVGQHRVAIGAKRHPGVPRPMCDLVCLRCLSRRRRRHRPSTRRTVRTIFVFPLCLCVRLKPGPDVDAVLYTALREVRRACFPRACTRCLTLRAQPDAVSRCLGPLFPAPVVKEERVEVPCCPLNRQRSLSAPDGSCAARRVAVRAAVSAVGLRASRVRRFAHTRTTPLMRRADRSDEKTTVRLEKLTANDGTPMSHLHTLALRLAFRMLLRTHRERPVKACEEFTRFCTVRAGLADARALTARGHAQTRLSAPVLSVEVVKGLVDIMARTHCARTQRSPQSDAPARRSRPRPSSVCPSSACGACSATPWCSPRSGPVCSPCCRCAAPKCASTDSRRDTPHLPLCSHTRAPGLIWAARGRADVHRSAPQPRLQRGGPHAEPQLAAALLRAGARARRCRRRRRPPARADGRPAPPQLRDTCGSESRARPLTNKL
jgi:hypothetical protein